MKVILLNGSSHNDGATASLLKEIEDTLKGEDIETEVFFIGNDAIRDCVGCRKCASLGKCVFDDKVNEFVEKARSADGFIFASPVGFFLSSTGHSIRALLHSSISLRPQYSLHVVQVRLHPMM